MGTGIRGKVGGWRGGKEKEREKFIMYNKTKGVMGNNIDIKIRIRKDLYEKFRFKNVNVDRLEREADLKLIVTSE